MSYPRADRTKGDLVHFAGAGNNHTTKLPMPRPCTGPFDRIVSIHLPHPRWRHMTETS